ncbi:MAG: CDP-alcohol phosphatidyltransferase family protein [Candidatus Aenigmarchaeota archaeon]|nr:CDP-alcohol phosphatidyltransferase family protein [Candidatus Aenigmarchaeota archaeon]
MTLYRNREMFQRLSISIGLFFSRLGLTPNQWSVFSIAPAIVSVYFILQKDFLPASVLFGISAFFDIIDGSVARVTGRVTIKGAYLDTIVDRYVEFLIILSLILIDVPRPSDFIGFLPPLPFSFWVAAYLFGSLMTTYAKAAAMEKRLVEKEIKGGLLERAERMVILFFAILLASYNIIFLSIAITILALLANITALQRIWTGMNNQE